MARFMTDEGGHFMETYQAKQRLFDLWAPSYDRLLPSVFYQAIHRRLLDSVVLAEAAYGLEMGCGTGKLLNRLAARWPHFTAVGLDLSPEMLRQARLATPFPDRLDFVQGRSDDLPFPACQFDAIFCSISFLHYLQPEQVFREVVRVLRPGGQFFLADFTPSKWNSSPQVVWPFSPGGLRFYSEAGREALGRQAQLPCEYHRYLLGPVMLSCFQKPGV